MLLAGVEARVLSSPHFEGGAVRSKHEVMVMTSLEDGVRSFAVDEFPAMSDEAVEAFWVKRVERHRGHREHLRAF